MSLTLVEPGMIGGAFVCPDTYGAVPYTGYYSGQPDASGAIQAAIDACPDGGVVFLNGKYFLENPITLHRRNVSFQGGTLEVDYQYTGGVIIIKPTPPDSYDVIGSILRDVRIQTTDREYPAGSPQQLAGKWKGQYTAIQIECAERAVVWNNIENVYISYPNIGFYWAQNTATPAAGYTTCLNVRGLNLEGAKYAFYINQDVGTDIYSGEIRGNTFTDCCFSCSDNASSFITAKTLTELEFSNCVFFNDGSPSIQLLDNLANSRLRITGGYWEMYPHNFRQVGISATGVRIISPNVYSGNPGYTTELPFFSTDSASTNYIKGLGSAGFSGWTAGAGATLAFANTFWNNFWVYNFSTGSTPGIVGYSVEDATRYSYASQLMFTIMLKQSTIGTNGWSVYAAVTYTDSSYTTFTGQQSPSSDQWEPVSVVFRPDNSKQIQSINLVVQGPTSVTAQICAPMFSVGTTVPMYPIPATNQNFVEQFSPDSGSWTLQTQNYCSTNPGGISLYMAAATSTTNPFLVCQDLSNVRARIKGNGDMENLNGVYGTISDATLKENIVEAPSFLDRLKQIQIVNYTLKNDPDKKKLLGSVAQQVEQIFPGLVYESQDTKIEKEVSVEDGRVVFKEKEVPVGDPVKAIKYSVFVPMLISAIQELSNEIDKLKGQ